MSENLKQKKKIVFMFIVFLLQFFAGKLPPIGEIKPLGMHIIFILIGTIIGWIFVGLGWPSITGILALGLSGAYPSMADCISACLGNQLAWLMAGTLFICSLIEKTNLSDVIAGFILNLKLSRKSPWLMSFFLFLTVWLISAVSNFFVAILLIISIYRGMAEKAKIPAGHRVNSYWLCGCAFSCVSGGMYLPWKATPIILGGMYTAVTDLPMSSFHWIICGMLASILVLIFYVLFCRFVMRIDLSAFDPKQVSIEKVKPNKEQKIILYFLLIMVLILVVPTSFPKSTFPIFVFFNTLGAGGTIIALLAVMMFVHIDGKPLLDINKSSFDWNTFFMGAFYITFTGFLSADSTGITATISNTVAPILQNVPGLVFVIVAIYLAMILSQFFNNVVVAIIFISALTTISGSIDGINLAAAFFSIYLSANAVCAMPSANPVNAMTFSNTDLVTFKNQSTLGWITNFAMSTFCVVIYFVLCIYFKLFGLV